MGKRTKVQVLNGHGEIAQLGSGGEEWNVLGELQGSLGDEKMVKRRQEYVERQLLSTEIREDRAGATSLLCNGRRPDRSTSPVAQSEPHPITTAVYMWVPTYWPGSLAGSLESTI